jgi:hypothetical protein
MVHIEAEMSYGVKTIRNIKMGSGRKSQKGIMPTLV